MNAGSLFSGVGGFDLGLERAGMSVLWQCEADPYRRAVLRRHWPGVPCFHDVREVEPHAIKRLERDRGRVPDAERNGGAPGRVDLVCGGFPCQDLSVAGRRRGLAGERSGLFFEFARVADLVLPAGGFVLVENVPGLLSSHGGRDFAVLLATLAELGFHDLAWRVLDSRYFGVPQRRRRVYILGRRARGRVCAEVLLEPEGGGGNPAPGRASGTRVAGVLGSGSSSTRFNHDGDYVGTLQAKDPDSGGWRVGADEAGAGHIVAAPLSHGSNPNSNAAGRRREDDFNVSAPPDADGVRAPSELPGRLDDPHDPKPDGPRYAAMGDAVTVNVAHWIGRRILDHASPTLPAVENREEKAHA